MYFFGDTYFFGFLMKNVFQILFCTILMTEFLILILTVWNNHRSSDKKGSHDKGSMQMIIVGYWAAIVVNPVCIYFSTLIFPGFLFWFGTVLILLGIFVRVYSVWTLKKAFTLNVQVGSEQEIISNGPYKYIRHPAYTGSILTLIGVSFSFRSVWGLIATTMIVSAIYGYRIKIEEKLLEESFGDIYKDYERVTWRLIPHIW